MIVRVADKKDARKMRIVLTNDGKKQKEMAKNSVRNFNILVERKIGKKSIEEFYKVLDTITEIAEERNKLI